MVDYLGPCSRMTELWREQWLYVPPRRASHTGVHRASRRSTVEYIAVLGVALMCMYSQLILPFQQTYITDVPDGCVHNTGVS